MALANLRKVLRDSPPLDIDPGSRQAKALRKCVEELIARLSPLARQLDPIQHPQYVLDLSNPETVGKLIGQTLLDRERQPLGSVRGFYGSGVYALYYRGSFPAYRPITCTETPIYVGKADPPTPEARSYIEQGKKLAQRLAEHAKSIRAASDTLRLEDFDCRFLVVQSGWQRSAEDYLLNLFKPIWNSKICFGFGKHGDDPRTRGNTRSPWDSLHPGRKWATKVGNKPNPRNTSQIIEQIAEHFRDNPPRR
ncbi:MAG: Eco29kI family restriction endonuclease [Pirellulaceae bacterium]|nr:Eco29kI family restriction endonuclease [Pirellulaceae bacterium]